MNPYNSMFLNSTKVKNTNTFWPELSNMVLEFWPISKLHHWRPSRQKNAQIITYTTTTQFSGVLYERSMCLNKPPISLKNDATEMLTSNAFQIINRMRCSGLLDFFLVFRISHPQRNGYQRKCLGRSNSCLSFSNAHWSYSMLTQHWVNFNTMLSQFFYPILIGLDCLIMLWL